MSTQCKNITIIKSFFYIQIHSTKISQNLSGSIIRILFRFKPQGNFASFHLTGKKMFEQKNKNVVLCVMNIMFETKFEIVLSQNILPCLKYSLLHTPHFYVL